MQNRILAIGLVSVFALAALVPAATSATGVPLSNGLSAAAPGALSVPWAHKDGNTILVFDDGNDGGYAAAHAASALGLSYDFMTADCSLGAAVASGVYSTIVINSQLNSLSICTGQATIFENLATYANGGGKLILQAWELDLCGKGLPCTAQSVTDLLGALGAQKIQKTHTDSPKIATTLLGACTQNAAPNAFSPLGQSTIAKGGFKWYNRDAQAVLLTPIVGTQCWSTASTTPIIPIEESQVLFSSHGAYVGTAPGDYDNAGMISLYEDILANA